MNNKNLRDFKKFMNKRLTASTAFVEGDFLPLKEISVEKSLATILDLREIV